MNTIGNYETTVTGRTHWAFGRSTSWSGGEIVCGSVSVAVCDEGGVDMKLKQSEHDIQTLIKTFLEYKGWFCFRNNSGMLAVGEGKYRRMIKMGQAGLPDLFAFKKDYPALGIEVKAEKGKTTELQERMLEVLRKHGVATVVARSVEEVERFIKMF